MGSGNEFFELTHSIVRQVRTRVSVTEKLTEGIVR